MNSQQKRKFDQALSDLEKADKSQWTSQAKSFLKSAERSLNSLLTECPDNEEVKKLKDRYGEAQKKLQCRETQEQLRSTLALVNKKLELFSKKNKLSSIDKSVLEGYRKDIDAKSKILSEAEGYAEIVKESVEMGKKITELLEKDKADEVKPVTPKPDEVKPDPRKPKPEQPKPDEVKPDPRKPKPEQPKPDEVKPDQPDSDKEAEENLRKLLDRVKSGLKKYSMKKMIPPKEVANIKAVIQEIESESQRLSQQEGHDSILQEADQIVKKLNQLVGGAPSPMDIVKNAMASKEYENMLNSLKRADESMQKGDFYSANSSYNYTFKLLEQQKAKIEGMKGKETYEELVAKAKAGIHQSSVSMTEKLCKDALELMKKGNANEAGKLLWDARNAGKATEEGIRLLNEYEPKIITTYYEFLLAFLKDEKQDPSAQKSTFLYEAKRAKNWVGEKPELLKIVAHYEPQFTEFQAKIDKRIQDSAEQEAAMRRMVFEKWGGEYHYAPFADKDGRHFMLWNPSTGLSILYASSYAGSRWEGWGRNWQMVQNPLKITGGEICCFVPFRDKNGVNVLVWNPANGKSILYYLGHKGWEIWDMSRQLSQNPLKIVAGESCRFVPFMEKDVLKMLVWNPANGKSILYYLDYQGWKEYDLPKQLPQNPLKLTRGEICHFVPFVDEGGSRMVIWNPANGKSILYYLDYQGWREYDLPKQLPQNPLKLTQGESCHFVPFVDKGVSRMVIWNPANGKSILYYLDYQGWKEYDLPKQLPQNPLKLTQGETCLFAPLLGKEENAVSMLIWNPANGKSMLYYLDIHGWALWEMPRQMPQDPVSHYINFTLIGGK